MTLFMRTLLELFRSVLTPCLHCGSLYCPRPPLCLSCFNLLREYEREQLWDFKDGPFPVFALYEWSPGESDLLSRVLLALKGPSSALAWAAYAPRFVQGRLSQPIDSRRLIVVPAPATRGGRDHAYYWGKALADVLEAEFSPCLKKRPGKQRGANRDQRRKIRLDLNVDLNEIYSDIGDPGEILWIFVDDIYTTGATAHAAYEALGSPPHFETWVLGRRSLSCGASTYLL